MTSSLGSNSVRRITPYALNTKWTIRTRNAGIRRKPNVSVLSSLNVLQGRSIISISKLLRANFEKQFLCSSSERIPSFRHWFVSGLEDMFTLSMVDNWNMPKTLFSTFWPTRGIFGASSTGARLTVAKKHFWRSNLSGRGVVYAKWDKGLLSKEKQPWACGLWLLSKLDTGQFQSLLFWQKPDVALF